MMLITFISELGSCTLAAVYLPAPGVAAISPTAAWATVRLGLSGPRFQSVTGNRESSSRERSRYKSKRMVSGQCGMAARAGARVGPGAASRRRRRRRRRVLRELRRSGR
jgi:hypothetical protein